MTRRNKGKATNNSNNTKRKRKEADAIDVALADNATTVGLKEEEKMNNNNEENGNNGADDDVHDAADASDLDNNNNNKADDFTEDFLTLGGLSDDDDNGNDEEEATTASKNNNGQKYVTNSNNSSCIDLPPWMNTYVDYRRTNYLVALHNEIVSFCHLIEPRPTELQQRQKLVDEFTKLALSVFKDCQVNVFGSQVTGLCLPTSDIDISIQLSEADTPKEEKEKDDNINKNDKDKKPAAAAKGGGGGGGGGGEKKVISKEQELKDMENWDALTSSSPLQRLGDKLREEWIDDLSYLEIIENTRVPLVKFTHGPTNISIDVCFNQTSGPQAAKLMFQYMDALPPLRPLTFVMKYFTESRALNQPYTGGIGSYMLQLMIVAFLQHRERETRAARQPSIYNLGALLIEFLEFYCTDFNYVTTGISVRYDGHFFRKGAVDRKDQFWMSNRPFSLAMENPLEPDMDVGASSFRISVIQRSFEVAFKTILCHVTEPLVPTTSILATILPPTEEMKQRAFDQRRTTTTARANNSQKTTTTKTTSMLDSALGVPRGSPIKNNDNRRGSSGSSSRRRSSGSISPHNNNSSRRGSGGSNSGRPRKRQRR